jgi:hypothetical protein
MANEITVSVSLGLANPASITLSKSVSGQQFTQAGKAVSYGVLVPATTPGTAIPKAGIGTIGFFYAKNLDAAINITLTLGSGGSAMPVLLPGVPCLFYINGTGVPWAFAASGSPLLEFFMLEA